jgi:hypothetical protein
MDHSALVDTYNRCLGAEEEFRHKALLFIGSESYDAPTITVLLGLRELGFKVYVIGKHNINSWFVDEVIETLVGLKFDFVLSNLHWGTRWGRYNRGFDCPKVLIDGDDDRNGIGSWLVKYARYLGRYRFAPSHWIKDTSPAQYRWVEPLYGYEPDVLFVSQNCPPEAHYLPFGLQNHYAAMCTGRPAAERPIDFCHFPGDGSKREELTEFLPRARLLGKVYCDEARGDPLMPDLPNSSWLINLASSTAAREIHSANRWFMWTTYNEVLDASKVLIYPGTTEWYWDSKRPWEGWANGCLVLFGNPDSVMNTNPLPVRNICPWAAYDSLDELEEKAAALYSRPDVLEGLRILSVRRAWKYFSPMAIARYFLKCIAEDTR